MNYTASPLAIILFLSFVATVLGISYHFARKTKSASGYFAAGGNIHWSVNGIAFAGDYLSAASFLFNRLPCRLGRCTIYCSGTYETSGQIYFYGCFGR